MAQIVRRCEAVSFDFPLLRAVSMLLDHPSTVALVSQAVAPEQHELTAIAQVEESDSNSIEARHEITSAAGRCRVNKIEKLR